MSNTILILSPKTQYTDATLWGVCLLAKITLKGYQVCQNVTARGPDQTSVCLLEDLPAVVKKPMLTAATQKQTTKMI